MLARRLRAISSRVDGATLNFTLTPASGMVTGTHTDMPVLVRPNLTAMGALSPKQARSIRCYSDAANTQELAREVVSKDVIWIKSDMSSSTAIYVVIDGVSADYLATDTYGSQAVWGGYDVALHFKDAASEVANGGLLNAAGSSLSVTSSNGNGITNGTRFTNSIAMTGAGSIVTNSTAFSSLNTNSTRTHTFWAYIESGNYLISNGAQTTSKSGFFLSSTAITIKNVLNKAEYNANISSAKHLIKFVAETTDAKIYIDGVMVAVNTSTTSDTGLQSLTFGAPSSAENDYYGKGEIANFTSTLNAHDADWALTEYNNQANQLTFWNVQ